MIDHIKLHVADAERSKAFYAAALAPLGYRVIMEPAPGVVGMGTQFPDFWLAQSPRPRSPRRAARRRSRRRRRLPRRRAGGRRARQRRAGLRPQYHPGYYGAFVFDPDGNNVEAVHHTFG